MSNECKLEEKLLSLVLGELDADEKSSVREHLDGCSHCKSIYADLKLGVEKFHAAYPELPDAPKKLSRKRFEEIIQIAKELENETPDTWVKGLGAPESEDDPAGSGTSWAILIGVILAIAMVLVILRPWDKSGSVTVTPDNENRSKSHTPKGNTGESDNSGKGSDATNTKANDNTGPFSDPGRPYKRIVMITSLQRDTFPQPAQLDIPAFKPMGTPIPVRAARLTKLDGVKDAIVDGRQRFSMTYSTDDASANALIALNDTVLLAGGRGAMRIRFDSGKKLVIVDGNKQELGIVRKLQQFIATPSIVRIDTASKDGQTNDASANDPKLVKTLKATPLERAMVSATTTFSDAMNTLAKWGGLALDDQSNESNAVVTLQFDNVSVWDAITQLCKAVDVNPQVADGTLTLLPRPHAKRMTTTVVKVSPAKYGKLLASRGAASLATLLASAKIDLSNGAGAEVLPGKTAIIIHHYDQATEEIVRLLTPCLLTKDETK